MLCKSTSPTLHFTGESELPLRGSRPAPPDPVAQSSFFARGALGAQALLAGRCHPGRQPSDPADCKSPPLSGRALASPILRKGKNKILPAPGPRPPVERAGDAEEKGGLYAHRREGTTSPPGPPTMPSGERRLCHAPRLARADTEPSLVGGGGRRLWPGRGGHRPQWGRPLGLGT